MFSPIIFFIYIFSNFIILFAFLSLRRQKVSTSCSQRRTRVSAKCFSIFVWRLVSKFAFFFNLLKQSRDGGANFAFVLRLLAQTVRHFRSFSPFLQKCEHFRRPQSVSASSRLVAREACFFNLLLAASHESKRKMLQHFRLALSEQICDRARELFAKKRTFRSANLLTIYNVRKPCLPLPFCEARLFF